MADLVGSKLRKKRGAMVQESLSAPTSDFAKKQLLKMGWTEGTGLGKRRTGITTHVKVKKREEEAGLGAEQSRKDLASANHEWWKDSVGNTLAKLRKKKSKASKRFSDEELFEATGGARFGMRAAPKTKLNKWKRTEGIVADQHGETDVPVKKSKKKKRKRKGREKIEKTPKKPKKSDTE